LRQVTRLTSALPPRREDAVLLDAVLLVELADFFRATAVLVALFFAGTAPSAPQATRTIAAIAVPLRNFSIFT
jgi:hypothetical protein